MGYREFKDEYGVEWRAWDVRPTNVEHRAPPTPAGGVPVFKKEEDRRHHNDSQEVRLRMRPGWEDGWLSFESDAEKRRLAPLPKDWEDAPVEKMREWLASATVFPKRGSFIE
jgi:hypothetical protein